MFRKSLLITALVAGSIGTPLVACAAPTMSEDQMHHCSAIKYANGYGNADDVTYMSGLLVNTISNAESYYGLAHPGAVHMGYADLNLISHTVVEVCRTNPNASIPKVAASVYEDMQKRRMITGN